MANRRTPTQIAEDELEHTVDRLIKAQDRLKRAEAELARATQAVNDLDALYEYQKQHPLLQPQQEDVGETIELDESDVVDTEPEEAQESEPAPTTRRRTTRKQRS